MLYAQYCRIESRAGGLGASTREFLRAARTLLSATGKSRAQRAVRHGWLREALAERDQARALYRDVVNGTLG